MRNQNDTSQQNDILNKIWFYNHLRFNIGHLNLFLPDYEYYQQKQ